MRDIIVIGVNYSIALGVIRSLGEAGYGVKLLAFNQNAIEIAGSSKYVKKSVLVDFNPDKIIEGLELLRGNEGKPLIIPLNDRCCKLLDEHYDVLKSHFCIPNINEEPGAVLAFMDKIKQKRLAQECGLLAAEGREYSTESNGITQATTNVKYPCFLKPLFSASIQDSKTAFAICNNEDELKNAMLAAGMRGCSSVLVEEFLNITKELCVYGMACGDKVYAPVLIETIQGGFAEHKGVTAEGFAKSANELLDIKGKIVELIKRINYQGLFCVDLLKCGANIYFSEINMRGGGSGYAATLAGANLPAALADMVYDNTTSLKIDDITREVRFINERIEFDAFKGGYISRQEYKNYLLSENEKFIKSIDDPKPWRQFKRMTRNYMVKTELKRVFPKSLLPLYRSIRKKKN